MKKRWMILLLVLALLLQGCTGAQVSKQNETIRISGAWALYPMMLVWADEYAKEHNAQIEVSGGGAGKGMSDVLGGQVDIGMVSRPIKQEELAQGAFYIAVAKDTVIGIVNRNNPVYDDIIRCGLSQEDLRRIFAKEVTHWGELFGKSLEDDAIVVYGRSDSSGAASVWATFLGGYTEAELQNFSDSNVSGDQAIAASVGGDPNAVSFTNMNYAYDAATGGYAGDIRPVPVDLSGDGALSADEDFYSDKSVFLRNVSAGVYPSPPTREEYLVANGAFAGAAAEFVDWILAEGQVFLEDNGYVGLTGDELAAERGFLDSASRD